MIAVSAYQGFAAANQTVDREAAALGTLYRDVSSYPAPIRGELQTMLRDYTRYVIEEAWPAQQRGAIPEGGTARVTTFQERFLSFEPQTRAEVVLHAETIDEFDVFVDYRRQRLHAASTGLPAVLWFVVGVQPLEDVTILDLQFVPVIPVSTPPSSFRFPDHGLAGNVVRCP